MPRSTVNNNNIQPPLPLAVNNTATNPADSSTGSSPMIGTQHAKPKSKEIKHEWEQSVAKLNEEIKELRDAMQQLLIEIRSLIANYRLETQLTPIADSLDSGAQQLTGAYASTDKILQDLKKVETKDWPSDAQQVFHTAMQRFQSVAENFGRNRRMAQNGSNSVPVLDLPQPLKGTGKQKPNKTPPPLRPKPPLPPKPQLQPKPPLPPKPQQEQELWLPSTERTLEELLMQNQPTTNPLPGQVDPIKIFTPIFVDSSDDEDSDVENTSKSNIDDSRN